MEVGKGSVGEHGGPRAAVDAAARAALRSGTLPGTFKALVTETTVEAEGYRRVAYRIERREISLRVAPAPGTKKRDLGPIPSPASLDPWGVDPQGLPSSTRTAAICPTCRGDKKVTCPACAGQARVRCGGCGGGGRVQGERGPKNCPSCRGRGDVKCSACSRGRVACPPCGAVGRVYAWLEVEATPSIQIKVHPREGVAALHEGLDRPQDLDRSHSSFRVPLVQDTGRIEPLPSQLGMELSAMVDPTRERVLGQRLQRFESPVHSIHYATRGSQGVIRVAGSPDAVLGDSTWGPLRRRLALAVAAGFGSFVIGSLVFGNYVGRAAWFKQHGNGGGIALLALLSGLVGAWAAAGAWLPRRARSVARFKLPVAGLAAIWAVIGGLWFTNGPSVGGVGQALDRADLSGARLELAALAAVRGEGAGYAEVSARLEAAIAENERLEQVAADEAHLGRVKQSSGALGGVRALAGGWYDEAVALQARAVVTARAEAELTAAIQAVDREALEQLATGLAPLDEGLANQSAQRAKLAHAATCRSVKDFACAEQALSSWTLADGDAQAQDARDALFDSVVADLDTAVQSADLAEKDLDKRKAVVARGIANAKLYEKMSGNPSPKTVQSLEGVLVETEVALEKQRAKQKATEERRKKAEERKQRKEAARRAKAEARARRAADRVSCCDGTRSPSCRYSQGSLRGCCSHHGGVC